METLEIDDAVWSLFGASETNEKDGGCGNAGLACNGCGRSDVVLDDGSYVCVRCNIICERLLDMTAEWRNYGYDDNKSSDTTRCGPPTNSLLPDSSLGTVIGNKMGECYEMRMLRKMQMWQSMTYKERSLYNIFDYLSLNASLNDISPSIIDEAKALYKKVSELKVARGDIRHGLIASSVFMSCKQNNVPRSAKEIAEIFNLKLTTMTRGCKKFEDMMKMDVACTTASDFILRFASRVNLNNEIKQICVDVARKVDELCIISENTPPSIAAGILYMVCTECHVPFDKKQLTTACNVSMVTVSKCYKKIQKYKKHLIDADTRAKYDIS
jgi:transcription initiation factor TFIIB